MHVLIGDIGNTTTKICLIEINTFKIKKIIYFNSRNIYSKKFLSSKLKKIIIVGAGGMGKEVLWTLMDINKVSNVLPYG